MRWTSASPKFRATASFLARIVLAQLVLVLGILVGLLLSLLAAMLLAKYLPKAIGLDVSIGIVVGLTLLNIAGYVLWSNRICAAAIGRYNLGVSKALSRNPFVNIVAVGTAIWFADPSNIDGIKKQ